MIANVGHAFGKANSLASNTASRCDYNRKNEPVHEGLNMMTTEKNIAQVFEEGKSRNAEVPGSAVTAEANHVVR